MFQLDDNFLQDLGLGAMPEDQKKAFLQHIYQELEYRVGTKLAEGLSDLQMSEFESLIDRDSEKIVSWLDRYVPGYEGLEDFQRLSASAKQQGMEPGDVGLLSEYAATKWLEINRPDYRSIVAATLEGIKAEIIGSRDDILGGSSSPDSPQL